MQFNVFLFRFDGENYILVQSIAFAFIAVLPIFTFIFPIIIFPINSLKETEKKFQSIFLINVLLLLSFSVSFLRITNSLNF